MIRALGLLAFVALLAGGTTGCGSSHGGSTPPPTDFLMSPPSGSALPPATTAAAYNQAFTVISGGKPPYTFNPISIPPGLTLAPVPGSQVDATLSGTPTQMGNTTVRFQVVDSTNQRVSNESYTLTVN